MVYIRVERITGAKTITWIGTGDMKTYKVSFKACFENNGELSVKVQI